MECIVKKRSNIRDESGKEIRLTYGLIVSHMSIGSRSVETYGVGLLGECEDILSCEMIEDVSPNLAETESLIEKLCEYQVTPTTVRDIIADFLEK